MKRTKIVIALVFSVLVALLAAISISPPVMEARQAMFNAAANHATLYVIGAAVIGFFASLYITSNIGE